MVKRNTFGINQRDIFEEIIWIESRFEVDCQEETAFRIELRKDFYGNHSEKNNGCGCWSGRNNGCATDSLQKLG